jgi:hypothetical protein
MSGHFVGKYKMAAGHFLTVNRLTGKTNRINESKANNLLPWKHSGCNIDNSVMLHPHDNRAKEYLAQHMTRNMVSLKKLIYEPANGK